MEFHFIRLKPTNGLVTIIDPKMKPRYMCFKNRISADLCVKHIAQFRAKYGIWPQMDLSSGPSNIKSPLMFKKRKPAEVEKFMEIETMDWDKLMSVGKMANASLFYCHHFGVVPDGNMTNLSFSAQEVDLEVDPQLYLMNLELRILD